jgi:phospholipid/cholesterol/gamma-HCH transport system substrate-binding protein
MSEKRLAWRVGVFAAVAVAVGAALLFTFSKGATLFTPTYELHLKARTVAGLRKGASVLLSGIGIGNVVDADVGPGGRGVLIRVRIKEKYKIHADARFVIEMIGFLGDQYVAIYPEENKGEILAPGSIVNLEEPFNFQEIGRSAADLIDEFSQTAKLLTESMERASKTVFSEQTLTNTSATLANFRVVSEKAVVAIDGLNGLVQSNSGPVGVAVTNLVQFSDDLKKLTVEFREMLGTNGHELTLAIKNIQMVTQRVEGMARDIEGGKGLAGTLIRDTGLQTNVAHLVANLTTLSSNLTKYGLLYKPKKPKPAEESPRVYPGRNPVAP